MAMKHKVIIRSKRGVEYDLLQALRRNPTIIFAGDDVCAKAADRIERLLTIINRAGALAMQKASQGTILNELADFMSEAPHDQ